jgi:hypothetical protein
MVANQTRQLIRMEHGIQQQSYVSSSVGDISPRLFCHVRILLCDHRWKLIVTKCADFGAQISIYFLTQGQNPEKKMSEGHIINNACTYILLIIITRQYANIGKVNLIEIKMVWIAQNFEQILYSNALLI